MPAAEQTIRISWKIPGIQARRDRATKAEAPPVEPEPSVEGATWAVVEPSAVATPKRATGVAPFRPGKVVAARRAVIVAERPANFPEVLGAHRAPEATQPGVSWALPAMRPEAQEVSRPGAREQS